MDAALKLVRKAVQDDDVLALRKIIEAYPAIRSGLDEPAFDFGTPLITHVRSKSMLDELLAAGADINKRSSWDAGSFGILDTAPLGVAAYAIERGATVTVHASSRLGMTDRLKHLIGADPQLVHARGGDGQLPLHFASTVEIAEYLLDHGAEIDARDIDHDSTAAQWMVRSRPEVARYLVRRGCKTDILMAAALGDAALVQKHLQADPDSIRVRVSHEYFPLIDSGKNGGTIYQWELGWFVSAVQVAKAFEHPHVFDVLMERCPPDEKLLNACWLHDEELVESLLTNEPGLAASLPPAGRRHLAHAARNDDAIAARLMFKAGLPLDGVSQHKATPLHWAAWHGTTELLRLFLDRKPQLEAQDADFHTTPLSWAMYASVHGWHPDRGDYPGTVEALLDAGAQPPDWFGGSEAVQEVLSRRASR
jgi:ankyrin repeat protein